ncbi:MAG: hypothetical protein ABI823_02635 [Bryobacteraceae bacterium]
MKLSKLSVAVNVTLLFLSGVAVGAFGYRLYTVAPVSANKTGKSSSDEYRKKYLNEMQTRLKLDSEQAKKLDNILDETRARFHIVRERNKPEFDTIRSQQVEKVRGILNEQQRAEYERMRKEREEHEKQFGRGSGPGI